MDGKNLAEYIDRRLLDAGIKKSRFFAESGISSATLSQWRTGQFQPSKSAIKKVADYFGISAAELTGEERQEDDDLREYLDDLKNDPEQRMLFNLMRNATKDELRATVAFIRTLREKYKEQ